MGFFAYDKVVGPVTIGSNQELVVALGSKTLVKLTAASGTLQIFGIAGGTDGAVVTLVNVSGETGGTGQFTYMQESSSASSASNRFRNPSLVNVAAGGTYSGVSYRYSSLSQRWWLLSHT